MDNIAEKLENNNPHKNKVHSVLANSYIFFFILFLVSIFLDFIFPLKIMDESFLSPIGLFFSIIGTILIIWAQISSHKFKLDKKNLTKKSFCRGPYYFSRSPTHLGIFLLILGFGFMSNALFIIILAVISFFITKFIFIRKEEKILLEKYGTPYKEYKELIKF